MGIEDVDGNAMAEPVLGAFFGRGSKVYPIKSGTKISGTKVHFLEPKYLYHFEPI